MILPQHRSMIADLDRVISAARRLGMSNGSVARLTNAKSSLLAECQGQTRRLVEERRHRVVQRSEGVRLSQATKPVQEP